MALISQTYKLDLVPDLSKITVVHCARFDDARHIEFILYSDGILYTMPSGVEARVEGSKPNGGAFSIDVTPTEHGVEFDLTDTMDDDVGTTNCTLILEDENEGQIGSAAFNLMVANAGIVADLDLSSTDFSHYIKKMEALMDESQSYRDEADVSSNHAADSAKAAQDSQDKSKESENASALSEKNSKESEENATASAKEASDERKRAHDWAVGTSNTEENGTDTNNSKYWAEQSKADADRAANSIDQLNLYSEIVSPRFHIDWSTMELIQDNDSKNISFSLDENKRLMVDIPTV